jgi:AcrR family transcriptional regulator
MAPKLKQVRARSKVKKAIQFEKILEEGKILFLKKGSEGFKMRNLAENLGMSKNNLYNYVISKRELWIAIRNRFYYQFKEENLEIVNNHKVKNGNWCDLILDLFSHFFQFAAKDYDRFRMMFNFLQAPLSDKIGKEERAYEPYRLLTGTTRLIQQGMNEGDIKNGDASALSLFIYSIVLGIIYVKMITPRIENPAAPVMETTQIMESNVSAKTIQENTLILIKKMLKEGI